MTQFSVQQRRALKNFIRRSPVYAVGGLAEDFLLKYVFFEAICRRIGEYYGSRPGVRGKGMAKSHASINLIFVWRSFSYFDINFGLDRLRYLLDSSLRKRGEKSARNLRNGLVHRWDENDVAEVSARHSSLCLTLDAVVTAISHRVNGRQR